MDFWEKHIYHEDRERALAARQAAAATRAAHVLQYRMVAADRRLVCVKDSAVFVDKTGARMCGIITDITDLEIVREQLKQTNENLERAVAERTAKMEQSLEAMETLCYGIAHDLKAPLRGLQGFIGILTSDYQEVFDNNAKMYAVRCQAALRRMGELVDAILAYGRLNHTLPELVPLRVNTAVERVLNALEPEIVRTKAEVNVQMSLPGVIGNPYLFEQALNNLLANAIKFARPGVAPEISISGVQADRHTARLTITDNGIGIPREFTKRMFGMFQKLHSASQYPGTGIGLAVVKRAVELMNGRLGVISDPDQGSSFWIELPLASG